MNLKLNGMLGVLKFFIRKEYLIIGSGAMALTWIISLENILVKLGGKIVPLILISILILGLLMLIWQLSTIVIKKISNEAKVDNLGASVITCLSVISTIFSLFNYNHKTGQICNTPILYISKTFSLDEKTIWLNSIKEMLNVSPSLWESIIKPIDLEKITTYNELLDQIKQNLLFVQSCLKEIHTINQMSKEPSVISFIIDNKVIIGGFLIIGLGAIAYYFYRNDVHNVLYAIKQGSLSLIEKTKALAMNQVKHASAIRDLQAQQSALTTNLNETTNLLHKALSDNKSYNADLGKKLNEVIQHVNIGNGEVAEKVCLFKDAHSVLCQLLMAKTDTQVDQELITKLLVELAKITDKITQL